MVSNTVPPPPRISSILLDPNMKPQSEYSLVYDLDPTADEPIAMIHIDHAKRNIIEFSDSISQAMIIRYKPITKAEYETYLEMKCFEPVKVYYEKDLGYWFRVKNDKLDSALLSGMVVFGILCFFPSSGIVSLALPLMGFSIAGLCLRMFHRGFGARRMWMLQ